MQDVYKKINKVFKKKFIGLITVMGGYKVDTEFERFVKCYNKTGMP